MLVSLKTESNRLTRPLRTHGGFYFGGGGETKEGTPLINTCDFTSHGLLLQRGVKTPPAAPPRLLDLRQNAHRFQFWQRPEEVATSGRKASRARQEVGCEGKK